MQLVVEGAYVQEIRIGHVADVCGEVRKEAMSAWRDSAVASERTAISARAVVLSAAESRPLLEGSESDAVRFQSRGRAERRPWMEIGRG